MCGRGDRDNMSEHVYYQCPICSGRAWLEVYHDYPKPRPYHCMRCGDFHADHYFVVQFRNRPHTPRQIANISGYLRENPSTVLRPEMIEPLENLKTPTVSDRAGKLLRYLSQLLPNPGDTIAFTHWQIDGQLEVLAKATLGDQGEFPSDPASEEACRFQLPLLSAAWAIAESEAAYLFSYLLTSNLLTGDQAEYRISPQGWKALEERPETTGAIAFVAMAFARELDPIWLGPISDGIWSAGYKPFRVDQKEHNDDITDEIIAGIRTAKFVFADFTEHRGGVYYEAGFASGLGIKVVRSVRSDHKDSMHFDTRQLSHIVWYSDKLDAFAKAITTRIVATIGQGPLRRSNATAAIL